MPEKETRAERLPRSPQSCEGQRGSAWPESAGKRHGADGVRDGETGTE